jgi:hypothetical protein
VADSGWFYADDFRVIGSSDWLNLFFASFWGHFGWMDVPFVLGSWWQPLLALLCLAGLAGTLR